MVDEARSFNEEQLSFCIRYTKNLDVVERFLTFLNVSEKQDADSLSTIMFNYLDASNIAQIPIVAQSYDGASVMSGRFNGVQQKVKLRHPCAIYTHCMAHRVNLIVIDMCKIVKETRYVFNCLESIYIHFSMPTNNFKFKEIQKQLGLKKISITAISDTRWNCRVKNCTSVKHNFKAIIEALKEKIENSNDRDVSQALGILSIMNTVSFIFHLIVLEDILQVINILSTQLQQKTATLGKAGLVIEGVIKTFEEKRSDKYFSEVWSTVELFSETHGIETPIKDCTAKRLKREPNHLKDFHLSSTTSTEQIDENKKRWRIIYFKLIDTIVTNIKKRFSTESLKMATAVDNFMMLNYDDSTFFIENYKELFNIDLNALKSEMMVVKNCVLRSSIKLQIDFDKIKEVVQSEIYPNLYTLLKVALSIPVSSATCERSFSNMRRIKNWLRTSMDQERFSSLAIINIERDVSNQLKAEDILFEYAKTNKRLQL
uniref:Zinc finger MYM-type protein 1 n=1 Tax=Melanaphis sacchari TaxID=742174 RepID=A0A2H8TX88_9HEMI